jgi:hypothetical protein
LLCHLGDNLESHIVGGFSLSFAALDVCRMCHQQYADLQDNSGIPVAKKWTAQEYDAICDIIESGQKGHSTHGVRERCLFNCLEAFHCIGGFPFDCMHDWLEKVAACDAQAVVLSLVKEGKLSVAEYNRLLCCMKYRAYESSDRPLPIKESSDKLCGKALSVALHLRIMPLIVFQLIGDQEDSLIDLMLLIHEINEIMFSEVFSLGDIVHFQSLLVEFFETRKACAQRYPQIFVRLSPKAHFITHYPEQIIRYGPLTCVWTARYEGKHRDFVGFSETSKNSINITKTVTIKHQKKLASRSYAGLFSAPDIRFPGQTYLASACRDYLPIGLLKPGNCHKIPGLF